MHFGDAMISQALVDRKCGFCCELLRLQWVRLVNSVEPVHSANAQGMANAKCGENLILLHIGDQEQMFFHCLPGMFIVLICYNNPPL